VLTRCDQIVVRCGSPCVVECGFAFFSGQGVDFGAHRVEIVTRDEKRE
jgi:hypothetical protein